MNFFNQLDLLEGLKRAQRFRLEDQRGTEINFELPDFLKDNKLKKNVKLDETNFENNTRKSIGKTPQPAPRLSIGRNNNNNNNNTLNESSLVLNSTISSGIIEKSPRKENDEPLIDGNGNDSLVHRGNGTAVPPPLPPKPRIKPTIWTNTGNDDKTNGSISLTNGMRSNVKGPIAERINMLNSAATEKKMPPPRTIYFDQLNSSFV